MDITTIFIIIATSLILGFTAYQGYTKGVEHTISYKMVVWSKKYPLIPFAWGLLMGHFFFPVASCV